MRVTLDITIKQPIPEQKNSYTFASATMTIDATPDTVGKIIEALKKVDGLEVK